MNAVSTVAACAFLAMSIASASAVNREIPGRWQATSPSATEHQRLFAQGSGFGAPKPAEPSQEESKATGENLEKPYDILGLPLDAGLPAVETILRQKFGASYTSKDEKGSTYIRGEDSDGSWRVAFDGKLGRLTWVDFTGKKLPQPGARETYVALMRKYGMPYYIATSYGDLLAGRSTVSDNASQAQKDSAARLAECSIDCCGGADKLASCEAGGANAACVNDCYYPTPPNDVDALIDWLFQETQDIAHLRLVGDGFVKMYWSCVEAEPVDIVRSHDDDHACYLGTQFYVSGDSYSYNLWFSNDPPGQ